MDMKRIILIFSLLCSTTVFACDKAQLKPKDAFNEADIIFHGKIENLRYLDNLEKSKTESRIIVTFKVFESWKGAVDKTITIHTTHNKYSCNGFVFKTSEEYLVYSRYNKRSANFLAKLFAPGKPTLGIKVYGGTKLISDAEDDLKILGKGKNI